MSTQKPTTIALAVPESLIEAAVAQRRISEILRTINQHEVAFERKREALDKEEDKLIHPLQQEAITLSKSIYEFAKRNKADLTNGDKKKTVTLPQRAGSMQWYVTPAAVTIDNVAEVLGRIKKLDLTQFIRTKEEINKEALLEDAHTALTIAGVTISQQEKFVLKPGGRKERLECNIKTKRWKITQKNS